MFGHCRAGTSVRQAAGVVGDEQDRANEKAKAPSSGCRCKQKAKASESFFAHRIRWARVSEVATVGKPWVAGRLTRYLIRVSTRSDREEQATVQIRFRVVMGSESA